jgi:hypothetical protein
LEEALAVAFDVELPSRRQTRGDPEGALAWAKRNRMSLAWWDAPTTTWAALREQHVPDELGGLWVACLQQRGGSYEGHALVARGWRIVYDPQHPDHNLGDYASLNAFYSGYQVLGGLHQHAQGGRGSARVAA